MLHHGEIWAAGVVNWGDCGAGEKEFVFEKNRTSPERRRQTIKSFLLLFFKKEDLAFASFYKTMATAITKGYAFDASSVTTKKTLGKDERPPEIKGDAWTKLKKPEQQKKIEESNKVITKANELALANAKVKQIKEHLKSAGNKSVSWGGETYKVPAAG